MRKWNLRENALEKTMIVAHRGIAGGNIPCNNIPAYEAALCQGADMIELDVSRSTDGVLYAFHPGMEYAHLHSEKRIDAMHSSEVDRQRFFNQDGVITEQRVNRLDEVFEHLKNRCYINVDKYWEHIGPITEAIRRHDMADQILVKAWPDEGTLDLMEQVAPDMAFMILQKEKDEWTERVQARKLNFVGVEALFATEESEFASRGYVERMNEKGLIVWVNSIVYDYRSVLTAGHNDDISVTGRPDEGWGWLIERGYNLIQTDWPLALRLYMEKRGVQ